MPSEPGKNSRKAKIVIQKVRFRNRNTEIRKRKSDIGIADFEIGLSNSEIRSSKSEIGNGKTEIGNSLKQTEEAEARRKTRLKPEMDKSGVEHRRKKTTKTNMSRHSEHLQGTPKGAQSARKAPGRGALRARVEKRNMNTTPPVEPRS